MQALCQGCTMETDHQVVDQLEARGSTHRADDPPMLTEERKDGIPTVKGRRTASQKERCLALCEQFTGTRHVGFKVGYVVSAKCAGHTISRGLPGRVSATACFGEMGSSSSVTSRATLLSGRL